MSELIRAKRASGITLKLAAMKDCRLLWQWRNDPSARKYFTNTEYVPYQEHKEWFEASLRNKNRHIFIVFQNNTRVGMVRFDVEPADKRANIHINISQEHRNQGLGRKILKEACHYAFENLAIDSIIARIKKGNEASIKAFTYTGFELAGDSRGDRDWITMSLSLKDILRGTEANTSN